MCTVGIEVDIAGFDPKTFPLLRKICDGAGLEITCLYEKEKKIRLSNKNKETLKLTWLDHSIFSSWPQYAGPRPKGLDPEYHLGFYREQLRIASTLRPVKINAQSGA